MPEQPRGKNTESVNLVVTDQPSPNTKPSEVIGSGIDGSAPSRSFPLNLLEPAVDDEDFDDDVFDALPVNEHIH